MFAVPEDSPLREELKKMVVDEQKADDIYLALRERFAKTWDDGYAQGVADADKGGLDDATSPNNPWRGEV